MSKDSKKGMGNLTPFLYKKLKGVKNVRRKINGICVVGCNYQHYHEPYHLFNNDFILNDSAASCRSIGDNQ